MVRNIYIVDDVESVRISLHYLLSLRSDQAIHGFASGDLFLAEAGSLDPGVLLLDLNMPGKGGMEVLSILGQLYPGKFAPLVITGTATENVVIHALQSGALDVVEKPYEAATVLDCIDVAFSSLAKDSAATARAMEACTRIKALSSQEREVLMAFIEGQTNGVTATALNISLHAVHLCRAHLLTKLNVGSLSAALRVAFAAGMIPHIPR